MQANVFQVLSYLQRLVCISDMDDCGLWRVSTTFFPLVPSS